MSRYIIIVLLFWLSSVQAMSQEPLGLSDEWSFSQQNARMSDNQFQNTLFNFNWYLHSFPTGNNTVFQYAGAGLSLGLYPARLAYDVPLMYGWLWRLHNPEPNVYLKTGLEESLYVWQSPIGKYNNQQAGYMDVGFVNYWDNHIDFLRDPNERTFLKTYLDYLINPMNTKDFQLRFGLGVYYQIQ
jgi:hypothetical protein